MFWELRKSKKGFIYGSSDFFVLVEEKNSQNSHLFLLRFLSNPEVNEGAKETELGAGGEDQQDRLDLPVESNTLHPVKQQEELSKVLKIFSFKQSLILIKWLFIVYTNAGFLI